MTADEILTIVIIPLAFSLLAWEIVAARRLRRPIFHARDVLANLALGAGNRLAAGLWVAVELAVLQGVYHASPLEAAASPAVWIVGVVLVDLSTYWYHRAHHRVRSLWAIHVVHHSSTEMNLTVGLRRPWLVVTQLPFLVPLALLGIPPLVVLVGVALCGFYTFPLHTTLVDRLPRWYEWLFNTPSHHRVHHASNPAYIDRNYGSILIVWDRLFGTFQPEADAPQYGLTTNIGTHNPLRIATHELAAIVRDMRSDVSWRDRLARMVCPPGWSRSETRATAVSSAPVGQG